MYGSLSRNFLPANTIGIVPAGGYHGRGKQSHMALKWLDLSRTSWDKKLRPFILTVRFQFWVVGVDGYAEITQPDGTVERRIYQFYGDYWHQCPLHFPANKGKVRRTGMRTRVRLTSIFRKNVHRY